MIVPDKMKTKSGSNGCVSTEFFLCNKLNGFWKKLHSLGKWENQKMDKIVNSESLFHSSLTRLMKCSILTSLVSRRLIFCILTYNKISHHTLTLSDHHNTKIRLNE